ncbi:transposase, partial [Candidatus Protochlamydia sp. R18]|uniref:transposase n=1 Tax=Candidatus Protochlamydia sp. R18 TaxID=1353977 RepID=UPI0023B7B79B
ITLVDKLMLKKRAMIESVNNLLKNSCQIEHHRHQSRWNFLSNLMAGLANYSLNPSNPRLFFSNTEIEAAKLLEYF